MHNKFMKLAVAEARKNIRFMTGGPFGACIVRNGKVIAVARDEHRYDAEIDLSREVSPKSIPGIFRNIGNLPSNDGDQPDGTLARSREFSVISQGTQKAAQ